MAQIDDLEKNINTLTDVILSLNEKSNPIDWNKCFLTPRQIAKKIMSTTSPSQPVDEKSIHMVVYGKYMVGSNGKLVDNEILYPDCVDKEKGMRDNHPMFTDKIKNMKKDFKNSVRTLNIKKDELKEAFEFFGKQIATGVSTIAASVVMLPLGTGAPMGISAAQSIVSAFNTLQSRILEILPLLGPLVNIPLLITEELLNVIFALINGILEAIIIVLGSVNEVKKLLSPLLSVL